MAPRAGTRAGVPIRGGLVPTVLGLVLSWQGAAAAPDLRGVLDNPSAAGVGEWSWAFLLEQGQATARVVARVPRGTPVIVHLDQSNDQYYKVTVPDLTEPGDTGFVWKEFLRITGVRAAGEDPIPVAGDPGVAPEGPAATRPPVLAAVPAPAPAPGLATPSGAPAPGTAAPAAPGAGGIPAMMGAYPAPYYPVYGPPQYVPYHHLPAPSTQGAWLGSQPVPPEVAPVHGSRPLITRSGETPAMSDRALDGVYEELDQLYSMQDSFDDISAALDRLGETDVRLAHTLEKASVRFDEHEQAIARLEQDVERLGRRPARSEPGELGELRERIDGLRGHVLDSVLLAAQVQDHEKKIHDLVTMSVGAMAHDAPAPGGGKAGGAGSLEQRLHQLEASLARLEARAGKREGPGAGESARQAISHLGRESNKLRARLDELQGLVQEMRAAPVAAGSAGAAGHAALEERTARLTASVEMASEALRTRLDRVESRIEFIERHPSSGNQAGAGTGPGTVANAGVVAPGTGLEQKLERVTSTLKARIVLLENQLRTLRWPAGTRAAVRAAVRAPEPVPDRADQSAAPRPVPRTGLETGTVGSRAAAVAPSAPAGPESPGHDHYPDPMFENPVAAPVSGAPASGPPQRRRPVDATPVAPPPAPSPAAAPATDRSDRKDASRPRPRPRPPVAAVHPVDHWKQVRSRLRRSRAPVDDPSGPGGDAGAGEDPESADPRRFTKLLDRIKKIRESSTRGGPLPRSEEELEEWLGLPAGQAQSRSGTRDATRDATRGREESHPPAPKPARAGQVGASPGGRPPGDPDMPPAPRSTDERIPNYSIAEIQELMNLRL